MRIRSFFLTIQYFPSWFSLVGKEVRSFCNCKKSTSDLVKGMCPKRDTFLRVNTVEIIYFTSLGLMVWEAFHSQRILSKSLSPIRNIQQQFQDIKLLSLTIRIRMFTYFKYYHTNTLNPCLNLKLRSIVLL